MDEVSHRLIARQEAHKRIIWACSWNPFGHEFATGSRDKNVKIWAVDKGSSVKQLITLPQFSSIVTRLYLGLLLMIRGTMGFLLLEWKVESLNCGAFH